MLLLPYQIIITFNNDNLKESVKDLDQDDIIYKKIENIIQFSSEIEIKEYYLEKNKTFLRFFLLYQITKLITNLIFLWKHNESYLNNLPVCLIIDSLNVFSAILIDYHGKKSKTNDEVKIYKYVSIIFTMFSVLLYIYMLISIFIFSNKINNIYYLTRFYCQLFIISIIYGGIYSLIYYFLCFKYCLKIRNSIEKCKHKTFGVNYEHVESFRYNGIGYNIDIYKIVNLKSFKKETNQIMNDNKCPICREDYQNNQIITQLRCNHYYHKKCIKRWLRKDITCPLCRKKTVIL